MNNRILYLCATVLAGLLAANVSAQTVGKTLVAQTQTPGYGSDAGKPAQTSPGHKSDEHKSGQQKHPAPAKKGADEKQQKPSSGSSPRQDDAGADTRGAKGTPGSNTGSTGHGGMPGSGASSGSGGTADPRGQ